jgi:hypothetical protein
MVGKTWKTAKELDVPKTHRIDENVEKCGNWFVLTDD